MIYTFILIVSWSICILRENKSIWLWILHLPHRNVLHEIFFICKCSKPLKSLLFYVAQSYFIYNLSQGWKNSNLFANEKLRVRMSWKHFLLKFIWIRLKLLYQKTICEFQIILTLSSKIFRIIWLLARNMCMSLKIQIFSLFSPNMNVSDS